MEGQSERGHSQPFTLHSWREVVGDGQVESRGRIQHVLTGHVYYFRSRQALIYRLSGMLPTEMPSERLPDSGRGEWAMQSEK